MLVVLHCVARKPAAVSIACSYGMTHKGSVLIGMCHDLGPRCSMHSESLCDIRTGIARHLVFMAVLLASDLGSLQSTCTMSAGWELHGISSELLQLAIHADLPRNNSCRHVQHPQAKGFCLS